MVQGYVEDAGGGESVEQDDVVRVAWKQQEIVNGEERGIEREEKMDIQIDR